MSRIVFTLKPTSASAVQPQKEDQPAQTINPRMAAADEGGRALREAIKRKDLAYVREVLVQGQGGSAAGGLSSAEINQPDEYGFTSLHWACLADPPSLEMVELLLAHSANVSLTTKNGDFPIHLALRGKDPKLLETILDAKADLESVGSWGETPLATACRHGNLRGAAMLLELRADANATAWERNTALMAACRVNSPDLVRLLVQNRADPRVTTEDGETALSIAIDRGVDLEICDQLLRANATLSDLLHQDKRDLLMAAVRADHSRLVQTMLQTFYDPDVLDLLDFPFRRPVVELPEHNRSTQTLLELGAELPHGFSKRFRAAPGEAAAAAEAPQQAEDAENPFRGRSPEEQTSLRRSFCEPFVERVLESTTLNQATLANIIVRYLIKDFPMLYPS